MSSQILLGFHAVRARLQQAPESLQQVFYDAQRRDKRVQQLVDMLKQVGIQVVSSKREYLDELSAGARHQGIVGQAKTLSLATDIDTLLDDLQSQDVQPLLLILDGVTDPHNLGACLRTADAAGVHAVLAPKDRAVGLTTVVRRVACGAAETVPYMQVTNLARTMRHLKERDIWLYGTDDQARQSVHSIDVANQAVGWVMGAEGEGLRRLTREHCDNLVRIPMFGTVESLNVSVATALCLYESVRQRASS